MSVEGFHCTIYTRARISAKQCSRSIVPRILLFECARSRTNKFARNRTHSRFHHRTSSHVTASTRISERRLDRTQANGSGSSRFDRLWQLDRRDAGAGRERTSITGEEVVFHHFKIIARDNVSSLHQLLTRCIWAS
jgi:hypothetical protein